MTEPLANEDIAHELRIVAAQSACMKANSEGDLIAAGQHWREFVRLISERSPKRVAEMEQAQGLS